MSARGGRVAAAAMTAVVMGLVAVPPAAGAEPTPSRMAAEVECPEAVDSEELAVELAASCGREVEVLESRTEWQTTHALPDGRMRLDVSALAERTKPSGEWADVDVWLVEAGEGPAPAARGGAARVSLPLFKAPMVWEFGGLSAIASLEASDIASAAFRASRTHPSRWIELDVTNALAQVAEDDRAAVTIGLRGPNKPPMVGRKPYRDVAQLSVTYNRAPSNHAPSAPADPRMTATSSSASLGCGTSEAPSWVSSNQPFLWATVADPDGGNVMAQFDVYDGETLVWDGGRTAAQLSGTRQVQQVGTPLQDGPMYSWTVFAFDGQQASASGQTCYFRVDSESPAAPSVQALDPEGPGEAAYPPDAESGGVGIAGRFQFSSPSADVVEFAYGFDSTGLLERQPVGDPVISWSPRDPGWHTLRVQAIDRAGNLSDVVTYAFGVAQPQEVVWLLEEGAGTTAADSGNQFPLSFDGAPTWVDGLLTEAGVGTDWALAFDDPSDGASTSSAVVPSGQSFSVSAIVRSRGEAVAATAVSQDGTTGPAFELGQVAGEQCPDGVGPCWAFQMPSPDGTGSVSAVFDGPVHADEWVSITGTFDATSNEATVHVCGIWTFPEQGAQVAASGSGLGAGPLRVGRSDHGGAPIAPWLGEVAEVRVSGGVIDRVEMIRACYPSAP